MASFEGMRGVGSVLIAGRACTFAGPMLAARSHRQGRRAPGGDADTAKKRPKSRRRQGGARKDQLRQLQCRGVDGRAVARQRVPPDLINAQQVAQGVHDAISGKASMTDKDRENLAGLVDSVGESNHRAVGQVPGRQR